ncbi:outer membrane beta-barrel family protein [Larkinella terrae]|uniref:TonB-dependent receptor n=1 Tax=Larkinella terrae TaxID=2025311 RepID=A0A7K0ENB0_9BACT|nr:outer membrane beta-barrel family protein [Larkinella terrae]MRS63212.1 TonB-dependent receptor [Larkinella terrae]
MKYLVFIVLVSGGISFRLNAQTADRLGEVHGFLVDSISRKPVGFATVSLFRTNKMADGTLADSLGQFAVKNLSYGSYSVTLSAVGYRSLQIPMLVIDSLNPVLNLGTFVLSPDVRTLQLVTVRGQKPLIEQRADGIVFNVESLPPIAGSSAADILRRVPLLNVDADGGLSIRGSSQVRVFIDGKPSDLYASSVADALKSIGGGNIVKVEVITHPSARYDAEGTDGVVNIITRKAQTNATNGNLGGILGNRTQNILADLQHKHGKWLVKADGFYQLYRNRNGAVLEREMNDFRIVQKSETRQTGRYFFGGTNVIYSLDSNHTLSAGYRLRSTPNRTKTIIDNYFVENETLSPGFQRNLDVPLGNHGSTFSVGYTGNSKDKKKEFSLLAMSFRFKGTNRYELGQTGADQPDYRENFNSKTENRDFTLQADYSQAFNERLKWETGAKLTRKILKSDSRFGIYNFDHPEYVNDPTRSNDFAYQSSVYALYTSFNLKTGKWQFVAGTRYEKTSLNARFKDTALRIPSFDNLVPNLLISRTVGPKSILKLGYTLKLVRPYFSYLNPTVNNSDSLIIQFGNPYLRPEITRRFQLSYSRTTTHLFTDIALFYNHNRNSIESIRTTRPDGVFENTWQNIGRNRRLGLSATLSWKPSSKLSVGATLTAQYVWLESRALRITNRGLMREFVPTITYKLPHGFSVYFYGFFDAKNIRLQGTRTGWKYYSLTFSKQSKNERFNLSLRLDTIFTPFTFITEETVSDSFYQTQTFRVQNQHMRLTFSYKLGKKEIKGPRVRQTDNPE